jgi:hypothetical protein
MRSVQYYLNTDTVPEPRRENSSENIKKGHRGGRGFRGSVLSRRSEVTCSTSMGETGAAVPSKSIKCENQTEASPLAGAKVSARHRREGQRLSGTVNFGAEVTV